MLFLFTNQLLKIANILVRLLSFKNITVMITHGLSWLSDSYIIILILWYSISIAVIMLYTYICYDICYTNMYYEIYLLENIIIELISTTNISSVTDSKLEQIIKGINEVTKFKQQLNKSLGIFPYIWFTYLMVSTMIWIVLMAINGEITWSDCFYAIKNLHLLLWLCILIFALHKFNSNKINLINKIKEFNKINDNSNQSRKLCPNLNRLEEAKKSYANVSYSAFGYFF
jgi:hypothetical protein